MLSAIPATRSSLERAYWVGLTLLAGLLLSTSLPPWIRALLAPLYLGSTASVLYRQGKGGAKEPAHFIESPQDSETHLRLALTASRTGVWDWDMVSDRLYWSPEACAIFGSGPVEQLEDFARMVHPEDSPGLWQEVDAAVAERRLMSTEFRAFRPDGRMVWMLGHGQVFFGSDGKPVKMLGTVTDITARRESEQQFRALFELSPEPVLIQTEGRLAMVNPALVRLLGAESAEELIGQELLERVHPESRPQIESLLRDGQSPDGPALLVRFLRLDGAPVDVEACIAPFMHANTLGAQFILRDVTERLQAEAERRALESKMRESQKMEAIGQLAGGVAHDFNNLLTVIEGNATLIQKSAELRPETGILTAEVLQAARRASVLTQQLLLFSRKKAMELRNLRLSEVTANALHLLRRLLGEDVTIEARLIHGNPRPRTRSGFSSSSTHTRWWSRAPANGPVSWPACRREPYATTSRASVRACCRPPRAWGTSSSIPSAARPAARPPAAGTSGWRRMRRSPIASWPSSPPARAACRAPTGALSRCLASGTRRGSWGSLFRLEPVLQPGESLLGSGPHLGSERGPQREIASLDGHHAQAGRQELEHASQLHGIREAQTVGRARAHESRQGRAEMMDGAGRGPRAGGIHHPHILAPVP